MFQNLLRWATLQYFIFLLVAMMMFGFWMKYSQDNRASQLSQQMRSVWIEGVEYSDRSKREWLSWIPRTAYETIFYKLSWFPLGWVSLILPNAVPLIYSPDLLDNPSVFETMDLYDVKSATNVIWGRLFPKWVYLTPEKRDPWIMLLTTRHLPTSLWCVKERQEKASFGVKWGYYYAITKDKLKIITSYNDYYHEGQNLGISSTCNFVSEMNFESKGFLKTGMVGVWPFLTMKEAYEYANSTKANAIMRLSDDTVNDVYKVKSITDTNYNTIVHWMEYLVLYNF